MAKTVPLAFISVISLFPLAMTAPGVFFSCCRSGDDTSLSNFTDNLSTAFRQAGLFVTCAVGGGVQLEENIGLAIYESKVSLILLSKQHGNWTLCLDQLVIIMRRRRMSAGAHAVVPVFYHVHPSDVAEQTGAYGEVFARHLSLKTDMAVDWTAALREIGDVKGIRVSENSYEYQSIQRILQEVENKLNHNLPGVGSYYFSWKSFISLIEVLVAIEVIILGIFFNGEANLNLALPIMFD